MFKIMLTMFSALITYLIGTSPSGITPLVAPAGPGLPPSEVTYGLTKMNILENIGSGSTCTSVASTLDYDIDFTCRLLNAGVGIKLLTADFSEIFQLTEAGSMLLESHPASLRSAVLMLNEETRDSYRSAVTSSLKSGVSGFKEAFKAEFW
ncbi:hypothetical protein TL16_g06287 [Triparma laevis f. inornata]|uniref:Uncharacterized protein n=2 Tax=Triparma laevis TaxID=1534972 RepID=A0A9W7F6G2_9STRA|nr:hypothetical protein TL16_g06287 [Triparma laevis f. inornata]GMI03068.1 hypothetical protein TrLO_g8898 [Triparma laevis f. longispina]